MGICKDKIIFVHKGAFGDFLQTWPTIFSMYSHFKNKKEFFFVGKKDYLTWLSPLNIKLLDERKKIMLDRIYGEMDLSNELREFVVIWFVLKRIPTKRKYENIFFLRGLGDEKIKVWQNYLKNIESLGVSPHNYWQESWYKFFVRNRYDPQKIMIFPGSGHRLKNWNISKYIYLAEKIVGLGEKVAFVLGPVEHERGFEVPDTFETIYSSNFQELQNIMLKAKLVIGNDSGPLHLAGFNKIPNITLFGPTDPDLWAPIDSHVVRVGLSCSPCTSTIDINCNEVKCIDEIDVDLVFQLAKKILGR